MLALWCAPATPAQSPEGRCSSCTGTGLPCDIRHPSPTASPTVLKNVYDPTAEGARDGWLCRRRMPCVAGVCPQQNGNNASASSHDGRAP